ncbi:MAG: NUDIX domain-containing protein [Pseudomonadales bacterium]
MPVIHVVAAVVRNGERLLLCQRPEGKRHAGLWEFPGGKVLDGESFADAARREMIEELGVHARTVAGELGRFQDEGSEFLIHFLQVEIDGEPIAHEHQAIGWFLPEPAGRLALAPADRRFVDSLLGRDP